MDRAYAIYRFSFGAAALYNLSWGLLTIFYPHWLFRLLDLPAPTFLMVWQCVGMFVLVYALAYAWAARDPFRFRHLILIGFLGKVFGLSGYLWFAIRGQLPFSFGWTILTNDLIWLPVFYNFLSSAAQRDGGWLQLIQAKAP